MRHFLTNGNGQHAKRCGGFEGQHVRFCEQKNFGFGQVLFATCCLTVFCTNRNNLYIYTHACIEKLFF